MLSLDSRHAVFLSLQPSTFFLTLTLAEPEFSSANCQSNMATSNDDSEQGEQSHPLEGTSCPPLTAEPALGAPEQPQIDKPTAAETMHKVTAMLCSGSIATYIQCELPMVHKRLTPSDRDNLLAFVKSHIDLIAGSDARKAFGELEFLNKNPLSVAKKLFLDRMETLYDAPMPVMEYAPSSYHISRIKAAEDLDLLIEERKVVQAGKDKAKKEAAEKREEERKLGGIGVVDGKPVFGPVTPWDGREEEEAPVAPLVHLSKDAIEGLMGSGNCSLDDRLDARWKIV